MPQKARGRKKNKRKGKGREGKRGERRVEGRKGKEREGKEKRREEKKRKESSLLGTSPDLGRGTDNASSCGESQGERSLLHPNSSPGTQGNWHSYYPVATSQK